MYRTDEIPVMEEMNLRSSQQVQAFLLSQGWQPTEWNFKKLPDGTKVKTSPKLTEDSFDSIKGEAGQKIAQLRKIWSRQSDLKRWLETVKPNGRIPTPIGGKAVTHRIRHATVVNVPKADEDVFYGKEMRELFIAPPGRKVIGCDSDSCQLRMLINAMNVRGLYNQEFADALLHGSKEDETDAHSLNKVRVNEVLGEELLNRHHAKTIFYASIFGGGVGRLAAILGVSEAKAAAVKDAFENVLPEMATLKSMLRNELRNQGYLSAIDGRPIYIRSPHMALVSLMQGDEAAAMEMSMCWADAQVRKLGLDAFQLIYYHDEYEYESSEADAPAVAQVLEQGIAWPSKYLGLTVPLTGSADIGNNWAEVH